MNKRDAAMVYIFLDLTFLFNSTRFRIHELNGLFVSRVPVLIATQRTPCVCLNFLQHSNNMILPLYFKFHFAILDFSAQMLPF